MFAVIFEVQPRPDRWADYLAIAGSLRPELEKIDGFIANERFSSRRRERRVLSLSIWRDEKAVIRWRTFAQHHHAQARGRSEIFEDYHLRVGEIIADNRLSAGHDLLLQRFDVTEIVIAKLVTITEFAGHRLGSADLAGEFALPQASAGVVDHESFAAITDPEKLLLLASWADPLAARLWQPPEHGAALRHRAVRIIRDYGLYDRREAPQYHPSIASDRDRR